MKTITENGWLEALCKNISNKLNLSEKSNGKPEQHVRLQRQKGNVKSEMNIKKKNDKLVEQVGGEHINLGLLWASDYKENKIFTVSSSGAYITLQCMSLYKVKQRMT